MLPYNKGVSHIYTNPLHTSYTDFNYTSESYTASHVLASLKVRVHGRTRRQHYFPIMRAVRPPPDTSTPSLPPLTQAQHQHGAES